MGADEVRAWLSEIREARRAGYRNDEQRYFHRALRLRLLTGTTDPALRGEIEEDLWSEARSLPLSLRPGFLAPLARLGTPNLRRKALGEILAIHRGQNPELLRAFLRKEKLKD